MWSTWSRKPERPRRRLATRVWCLPNVTASLSYDKTFMCFVSFPEVFHSLRKRGTGKPGFKIKYPSIMDISHYFNPLSTGQSKIGRRRPISLDCHCVNISQWIFINKISLERSFHYLNADTLFLKIEQEMTPLQPFEVTQLIDFALDRSTSVTCGRDFAHSITMVTWNV